MSGPFGQATARTAQRAAPQRFVQRALPRRKTCNTSRDVNLDLRAADLAEEQVAHLAQYARGPSGIRACQASREGNAARTETSTEQSFMIHCRKDDRRAVHTRCMSSRTPSIGAVCFAVFMTVTVLWPAPARADGWTLPASHSEWGSFALGIISGLGVQELGHLVVARAKSYRTSFDGLSIV